ncbi:tyrosine-type recombinase/integrase [Budvicia aquatica]|uniref:Integrase n=1 Tax=Budvicia aquatica TaxID=82979 RepID=A0A2C6C0Q4_9GAMM|nr:tyrosine-type recombinase/integrase [Budvicia aquatica]PHI29930.1 integrase [Budvicia aquatica]GKX51720.1 DNA recombinase [Budvicia aquatica]VFS48706.1 Tyrosine recombinase XerD [Budvicia aquatica]
MQRRYITKHEWELVFKQLPDEPDYYRDRCMLFMTYIHGLRVSELTGLRVSDIDMVSQTLYIARLKNGFSTIHPLLDSEITLLEKWITQRNKKPSNQSNPWLFTSNKGGRISRQWVYSLIRKYGEQANLPVILHPHTLRHACGYSLADQGMDTRLIQDYLGHRNIRHTVHYTASNPKRFNRAWQNMSEPQMVFNTSPDIVLKMD